MSQPPPMPPQPSPTKSLITIPRVVGVILCVVIVRGCFWASDTNDIKIVGTWTRDGATLEFTEGGKAILTLASGSEPNYATYELDDARLMWDGDAMGFYQVEFPSDDELLIVADYQERDLEGRWSRKGVSPAASNGSADDVTSIQAKLADLEQRRASIHELMAKAGADQRELVGQLRQAGITSSSDLKSNPAPRSIAQNLARLTKEIQSLKRDALRFDNAISEAKSLIRRVQQSKVAVSSDEFAALSIELMTTSEMKDGIGANAPLDPISLEAVLNEALSDTSPMTPLIDCQR